MELNDLQKIVIIFVFVSMILGVGVLVLDSFSRASRVTTSYTDANVNMTGGATLTKTYCEEITAIKNAANATTYSVDAITIANADTCRITSTTLPVKSKFNVTYNYGLADDATTATNYVVTAVQGIGSTWMSLIVTVAILAIILTLVIGSFAGKR